MRLQDRVAIVTGAKIPPEDRKPNLICPMSTIHNLFSEHSVAPAFS